ncbi:hypothetical protein B0H16DRAFT_1472413 [Mycena metata]|uniref:Uncharacterized protein n=1 Tax=Mycena metata TaxID=1033252 RepID=A0AAD7MMW0_9AGAR|nr:hypothetical protein B0H16DRAFT_1472413 [Mycena metata]
MANIVHEIVVPSPTADYVVHEFVATSLSTTPPGRLWREVTFTRFLAFANHNHFHSAVNRDARLIFPPATTPDHDNKPRPTIGGLDGGRSTDSFGFAKFLRTPIIRCQLPSGHIQLKGSRLAYTLGINKRAVPSIKVCDSSILAPSLLAIAQSESALDQLLPELTSGVARGPSSFRNTLLSQLYCGPVTTPFYTSISPAHIVAIHLYPLAHSRYMLWGGVDAPLGNWQLPTAVQHASPAARQSSLVMPPECAQIHIDKFVNAGAVGM